MTTADEITHEPLPVLTRVSIREVDVTTIDLMVLLVKLAVAAIPASVILALLWMVATGIFAGVVGSL